MKKKQKRVGVKYNRTLVSAVLIGLMSTTPYTSAGASEYLATKYLDYNGKHVAEINFLKEGQGIGAANQYLVPAASYNLSNELISAMAASASYWTNMLGPNLKNTTPWQIFVSTDWRRNASAASKSIVSNGERAASRSYRNNEFFVTDQLQNGTVYEQLTYENAETGVLPEGKYGFSRVMIGYYSGAKRTGAIDGWWVDTDTVLPTNEQATNFAGTVRHELGHALGITARKRTRNDETTFLPTLTDEKSWTLNLYDQNGNRAKPGMQIITSDTFAELQSDDPSISSKDYFIVDKTVDANGNGFAYFTGPNVVDALGGGKFYGRSALPVNGWERDKFDGSHIQTAGMMSHRDYSNYSVFLEAELAALQDLGYKLDRKAYYGRSIYGNGGDITNTQGYFARNASGTAYLADTYSEVPLGIGLHVYGYDNTVTQAADILTHGTGAVGIRVDGMKNNLIIPEDTEIHSDGYRGNGVMIAYGRDQNVNQAGTVTAMGDGGTAIRFDFGSGRSGGFEYRGSYIRYRRWVNSKSSGREPGDIYRTRNLDLTSIGPNAYTASNDELEGALVNNYNLSGTLAGKENAIYIGKSAFVKNININNGAKIQGNIVSDWKQFYDASCEETYDKIGDRRDVLRIQYGGNRGEDGIDYHKYIPDLVTNLNFNTDLYYSGNITGEDNMKMNVNVGTLTYEGTANVVNVQVAKDAALLGGTYTVNAIDASNVAEGFTDTTTGQLINHGTIGASADDRNMTINGTLVSDGNLQAYGGGKYGQIKVNGPAKINGSTATACNMLPGETDQTVLTAQSIEGNITNVDKAVPVSGMLNAKGKISGNTITVDTLVANNLGTTDAAVNHTYDAVMNMYDGLGDEKFQKGELRKLFSLEPETAVKALQDIASPNAAQGITMAQTNAVTSHILSMRLSEAYAMKDVDISVPVANLADGKDASANEGVKLKAQVDLPVENNIWFKTAKNWGELKGGANYHGTTFALGYDKAVGRNWRVGGFVSYGNSSFAAGSASSTVQDTRLGVYAGYKRGPHEGYVYLNHGWLKNDLRRGITGIGIAKADYNSRILELGGEYKYDLQANKVATWHVSPYVNMQLSHLWQDGYKENDVGALGQRVNSAGNTYFATGLGVEFKRYLNRGSYAMRLGVKHAFSGANPRVTFGLVGGGPSVFEMRGQQDKTHLVMSISGETEFKPGWSVSGDAAFARGSHDRDIMCAVTLRRMW